MIVTVDSICGKWYQITAASDTSYTKTNFTYYNLTAHDRNATTSQASTGSLPPKALSDCINDNNETDARSDLMSICHWEDPSINKEWRENFEKDPWTSQRSYWDEWDFFPARRDRYRCIAENNMYQVSNPLPLQQNTLLMELQWGFSYKWLFTVCILNYV